MVCKIERLSNSKVAELFWFGSFGICFFTTLVLGFIFFLNIYFFFVLSFLLVFFGYSFLCSFLTIATFLWPPFPSSSESLITSYLFTWYSNRNSLVWIFSILIATVFMNSIFWNSWMPDAWGTMCKFSNKCCFIFSIYSVVFWSVMFEGLLCSLQSGPKYSKVIIIWQFTGNLTTEGNCSLVCPILSNITQIVYPYPPSISNSILKVFTTSTHLAWPLTVRWKQQSLPPNSESAPHCDTTALGWYISITFRIRGLYNFSWLIIHTISQWKIDSRVFAFFWTNIPQVSCSR